MADKQCENGHLIDESWDLCPYCPLEKKETVYPIVKPRATRVEPKPPERDPGRPMVIRPLPAAERVVNGGFNDLALPRTSSLPRIDSTTARRFVVGWLVGLNESARGESYSIRVGRNTLGRDRKSDIVVDDNLASTHHADLVYRPEEKRYILMDANSTNGTFVNDEEIQPRRDLTAKDVVRIGTHRFLFMPLCSDGFSWEDEGLLK